MNNIKLSTLADFLKKSFVGLVNQWVLVLLTVVFLFTAISVRNVYSQTSPLGSDASPTPTSGGGEVFDFARALQNYNYSVYLYDKTFYDYQSARARYLNVNTLATESDARNAMATMLMARDEVIRTYLTALRMRLSESVGVSESIKEAISSKVDQEVAWYADHKSKVPSAQTIDDLISDSDEARNHYEATKYLVYSTLLQLATGKTTYYRNIVSHNISDIRSIESRIRANGDKDVVSIERALIDTENKLFRSEDKEGEAQKAFSVVKESDVNKSGIFEESLSRVQDAYIYIKDANSQLKEIVRQIKTAD